LDQSLWGTPSRIVRPEYPKAAAQARLQGAVEIEGVVDGSASLSGVLYKPDTPASEVFVSALKAVVPYWRFYVPMESCMPKPEKVTARVEFAFEGDEPKIFTSYPKRPENTNESKKKEGYVYKAIRRVDVQYPRSMLYARQEALVYTRIEVAASGEVTNVAAEAYAPGIAKTAKVTELGTRLPSEIRVLADFEEEARRTLMQWRYSPNPGDWKGCYTLNFQMKK
jgi:hypothetical protein